MGPVMIGRIKFWHKLLKATVVVIGGLGALLYGKNQPPQMAGTDYCECCINQAAKPVGQAVIFVSHLVVPEVYR